MAAEQTKRCPDCAEEILAAARKCRYCGYRFDRRSGSAAGGSIADLLGSLRRDTGESSFAEVLADWGIALADGEDVVFFRLVELDRRSGYLLVTAIRVVFFAQHGRRDHEVLVDCPRDAVAHQLTRGLGGRSRLELVGPGFRHAVRGVARGDLERLTLSLSAAGSQ